MVFYLKLRNSDDAAVLDQLEGELSYGKPFPQSQALQELYRLELDNLQLVELLKKDERVLFIEQVTRPRSDSYRNH
jgi:hypothetical protein